MGFNLVTDSNYGRIQFIVWKWDFLSFGSLIDEMVLFFNTIPLFLYIQDSIGQNMIVFYITTQYSEEGLMKT